MPEEINILTTNPQVAEELASMSMEDAQNMAFLRNRPPSRLVKFIHMDNIASSIDQEGLDDICNVVLDAYSVDENSRSQWKGEMKDVMELISTDYSKKSQPHYNAANVKYPLIMQACMFFNARIMPQLIKGSKVVKTQSFLPDDASNTINERLNRISTHMSYQLLHDIDYWKRETDKLMIMLPLLGTIFRKSYFNNITGKPEVELCLPDRIVVNANAQSLEKAQRITHVIYMTSNELIENMRSGLFLEYDMKELSSQSSIEEMSLSEDFKENKDVHSYSSDKEENETLFDSLHEIYEQHRYLDLDGDGYQEPYVVTVHKSSKKMLRIVARYDESSFEYNEKGKMSRINATNYFTDYHFIPNPTGGFYSLGYGCVLYVLNETINTLLNQLIDAGTLSNNQNGFIGSGVRLEKGDLNFKPREWKQLKTSGSDLAKNIVPLPVGEPSQTLFQLLSLLIDSSRGLTAVSDVMTGELPPPNTPAATVMALVEQGQQAYNIILSRIYDSLTKEFQKLYDINKKYLREEEYFPTEQGLGMITFQDYQIPQIGISPIADPSLSSNIERINQAQALLQLIDYPEIDRRKVIANYLDVLKISDVESYMPPPDPNAPPPIQAEIADAQKRAIEMNTACQLLDRELEAAKLKIQEQKLLIDEIEVKSKTAYYGGRLGTDKIDSIVKLTELERAATPEEITRATSEEEALTQVTQQQDISQDLFNKLQIMEENIANILGNIDMLIGQRVQGEVGGMPPPGIGAPQGMPNIPSEMLQGGGEVPSGLMEEGGEV